MKKRFLRYPVLLFSVAIFLSIEACDMLGGSDDSDDPGATVYTGGAYSTGSKKGTPCYWKGTEPTALNLPSGYDYGGIIDIQVVDGTIYSSGYCAIAVSEDESPCYWKGTVPTVLPIGDGGTDGWGDSIFVTDGVIYTAGFYENSSGYDIACYWKDAVRTELSAATENSRAYGICFAGGKLYVTGQDKDKKACYWIDGEKTVLTSPASSMSSRAYSITVSNGVLYIGGDYEVQGSDEEADDPHFPCYWVDGAFTELPLDTEHTKSTYQSFVADGIVYTSGNYGTGTADANGDGIVYKPCYWKGTTRSDITVPDSEFGNISMDVFVSGDTVYSVGYYNPTTSTNTACYWKGNERTKLSLPAGFTVSQASCIFVE